MRDATLHWCYRCRQDLPAEAFSARGREVSGHPCRPCRRALAAEKKDYYRVYMKALQRARAQLAREYPERYRAVLAEHLDALRATEEPDAGVVVALRP